MYNVVVTPPNQANDPHASYSVIGHEAFTSTVEVTDAAGNPVTSYNSTVTLYANDGSTHLAYNIGSATATADVARITSTSLNRVFGETGSTRLLTGVDTYSDEGTATVTVWWKGYATEIASTSSAGYACGYDSGYVVALPVAKTTVACGTEVYVQNPANGRTYEAERYDVGPWVPCGTCGDDSYWTSGDTPWAVAHDGQARCDICCTSCGSSCGCGLTVNGAIIDLSSNLMKALTTGTAIDNAIWRFA